MFLTNSCQLLVGITPCPIYQVFLYTCSLHVLYWHTSTCFGILLRLVVVNYWTMILVLQLDFCLMIIDTLKNRTVANYIYQCDNVLVNSYNNFKIREILFCYLLFYDFCTIYYILVFLTIYIVVLLLFFCVNFVIFVFQGFDMVDSILSAYIVSLQSFFIPNIM